MKSELAGLVILGTSGGGTLAWLLALWGCLRLRRPGPGESEEPGQAGEARLLTARTRMVSGAPDDVIEGLVRVFEAASRSDQAPPLFIKRERDQGLAVTAAGQPGLTTVPAFSRCQIEIRAVAPSGSEIAFRSDHTELRRRALRLAGALLIAGLATLVGGSLLLWLAAPRMPKAAGLVQMVQCALFLSLATPWVVYALYRRARRATELFLDSAAANAAVLAEAFAAKHKKAADRPSPGTTGQF